MALVGMIALSLLFSQYYFSTKTAIESTNTTFKIISKNISEHLRNQANNTRNIVEVKSKQVDLMIPITFDVGHPVLQGFIDTLQFNRDLHAIYFAQSSGHYFEVINMQNRPYIANVFHAPKETYWTVVTIIDNMQQNTFLNKHYEVIATKRFPQQYNPLERVWYKQALVSNKQIRTKPYVFALIQKMGFTYAKRIKTEETVLAVDYTMEQLNTILSIQKHAKASEVFIVNSKGIKVASSSFSEREGSSESETNQAANSKEKFRQRVIQNNLDKVIRYEESGKEYFMILHALLGDGTYLGIRVETESLLAVHKENLRFSFYIAFLLLLLSIPVILWGVKSIVRPIKDLIVVNNKIKERKLSEVTKIDSNIIEMEALSDSLVSMSQSIQSYEKSEEALLDSIIKLLAEAIDEKSPYTGKHCERVPKLAQLLLEAVNASQEKAFKAFSLTTKEELREFEIAAWLHDCGKVTTPEYVVDKAVKLETIYNRIHEIRMRFEVLWRDADIAHLRGEIDNSTLKQKQEKLQKDFAFLASVNLGEEQMDEVKKRRVKEIADTTWERYFNNTLGLGIAEKSRYVDETVSLPATESLLNDAQEHIIARESFDFETYAKEGFKLDVPEYLYNHGEVYNLCIPRGTLTKEEKYKIKEHAIMTIKMLEKIPFPTHLKKIPEYAGTHHETLNGTGYPKKLTAEDLSIPARIMAIADIFEALTASDRPYKKAKTLSESIKIMYTMVKEKHIDQDIFELFLRSGVYKDYAQYYLKAEQIDEVEVEQYLSK